MDGIAVGFSGKIGSGKSTLSKLVTTRLGWQYVSFGDYVRATAIKLGLDASKRDVLQELGVNLINEGWDKFCISVLNAANCNIDKPFIIDGIRHHECVITLKRIITPMDFKLIFVDISETIQEQRIIERGIEPLDNLKKIQEHSTEIQVNSFIRNMSDLVIDGSEPIDKLENTIISWIFNICSCKQV